MSSGLKSSVVASVFCPAFSVTVKRGCGVGLSLRYIEAGGGDGVEQLGHFRALEDFVERHALGGAPDFRSAPLKGVAVAALSGCSNRSASRPCAWTKPVRADSS